MQIPLGNCSDGSPKSGRGGAATPNWYDRKHGFASGVTEPTGGGGKVPSMPNCASGYWSNTTDTENLGIARVPGSRRPDHGQSPPGVGCGVAEPTEMIRCQVPSVGNCRILLATIDVAAA